MDWTAHSGTGMVLVVDVLVVVDVASAAGVVVFAAAVLVVDIGANVGAAVVSPDADWHATAISDAVRSRTKARDGVIGQGYVSRRSQRCITM